VRQATNLPALYAAAWADACAALVEDGIDVTALRRIADALDASLPELVAEPGAASGAVRHVPAGDPMITDHERALLRTLGTRIRLLRTARRMSQGQLGEAAGVTRVTTGSVERGDHPASLLTYLRLAAALDVSLFALLDDERDPLDVARDLGRSQSSP
jgi:DNA-binding XRE family transcriptional regulator